MAMISQVGPLNKDMELANNMFRIICKDFKNVIIVKSNVKVRSFHILAWKMLKCGEKKLCKTKSKDILDRLVSVSKSVEVLDSEKGNR